MIDTNLVPDAGNLNSPVLIVKEDYDGLFLYDPYGCVLASEFARCGLQASSFHLTHLWRYKSKIIPADIPEHMDLLWKTMRDKRFVLFLGKAAEPYVDGDYENHYGLLLKSNFIPENVQVAMIAPTIKFATYSHGEMRHAIETFSEFIRSEHE